ncbi:phosphatidylserine decarboxylase [Nitrosophilus alvini]|uniref:phosphatidylserine decarboxylase n=1 Tax=Nitrosophilus alvini TaxID=2714855 RepID=UPI00190A2B10|nr:phosphatidylserine decarboxylase [Nitrosophilus alvini]
MIKAPFGIVAKEGIYKSAATGGTALFVMLFFESFLLKLIFLSLFAATLYLYRDPERIPEEFDEKGILSPVDGVIESIDYGSDEITVTIISSIKDVSVIRSPIAGDAKDSVHIHGAFLDIKKRLSSRLNEKIYVNLNIDEKRKIKMEILSDVCGVVGFSLYEKKSGSFFRGERIGFAGACRAKISLPLQSEIRLAVGDRVTAGEKVIGYIKE